MKVLTGKQITKNGKLYLINQQIQSNFQKNRIEIYNNNAI